MHQKIKRGFFSFTTITRNDEHRAYNEWHLFDHIPENLAIEGIAGGQRWVCPPEYAKQRTASDAALAASHYMTLYLVQDPADQALREFVALGPQLDAVGRFHRHRKSLMGGPYQLLKSYAAPRALVAPAAIPFRPNWGLYVSVDDLADPAQEDRVARWLDDVHLPRMLGVRHVAGACWFRALHDQPAGRTGGQNPAGRRIVVYYLDGDPLAMLADLRARQFDDAGAYTPVLTSLYRTIPPDSKFDWFDQA